jgi:hypothetical protein
MEHVLWVLAIIISIVIAHFYYRLSLNKALSFFLLLDDRPLSKVDPNVRARLAVKFSAPEPPPNPGNPAPQGEVIAHEPIDIGDLQHLQVVIANTGVRAITFQEAPILPISVDGLILDASIIHQCPLDLSASLARLPVDADGMQKTRITIPMLNRGEYVVVKFLLSGIADTSSLKLQSLAEDLPRSIPIKPLPANATKSIFEAIDWMAVWIGATCIAWAIGIYFVNRSAFAAHPLPDPFKAGVANFFHSTETIDIGLFISCTAVVGIGGLGAGLMFGMGLGAITKRHRIVLPKELRPNSDV